MPELSQVLTIKNKKGLHARAAAKFVKTASQFDASIRVTRLVEQMAMDMDSDPDWCVSATSILGLMMLGAEPGAKIQLDATGAQAQEAVAALQALVDNLFDEGE